MAQFLILSIPLTCVSYFLDLNVIKFKRPQCNILLIDPAAGASDDWYKGVLKSRFAYTVELRDTGRHGFILPPDQIKPSGEELWEAERVVFQKMIDVSY